MDDALCPQGNAHPLEEASARMSPMTCDMPCSNEASSSSVSSSSTDAVWVPPAWVPPAWVRPVPFDCVAWARRYCGFKENPLFHASPELPCSKWCFSDLWQSMSEEVGYSVVYNCEKECAPDKAQWQVRHLLIQDKRIECDKRTQEILEVVMCDALHIPIPSALPLAAHGRWPTERNLPVRPPSPAPASPIPRATQVAQQHNTHVALSPRPRRLLAAPPKSPSDKRERCSIQ